MCDLYYWPRRRTRQCKAVLETTAEEEVGLLISRFGEICNLRVWRQLLSEVRQKSRIQGYTDTVRYNHAGLKFHKRLVQLGALPIISLGKGDEQHPEGFALSVFSCSI